MWIASAKEIKSLPPSTRVLFIASMVNRMGTMVLPFMTLYLTRKIGLTISSAGNVLAAYGLTAIVVSLLNGWLYENIGAKKTLLLSLFLTAGITILFPLAKSFGAIILMTGLLAFVNEPFRPMMMTLMGDLVPNEKRKVAITFLRLSINLGMSVGPALGGWIATRSFTGLFIIDGITSLLAGIFLWRNLPQLVLQERKTHPETDPQARGLSVLFKDIPFLFFLLAQVGIGLVFFQPESTMPLFMVKNLGLTETDVGLVFLLNTLIVIFFEIPINLRLKEWAHLKSMILGTLATATGFGLLYFAHSYVFVLFTTCLWTFGEMIIFASATSWVSERASEKNQGLYMGYFYSAWGIATLIGPWGGTHILDKAGAPVLWATCFVVGLIPAFIFGGLKRRPPKSVA